MPLVRHRASEVAFLAIPIKLFKHVQSFALVWILIDFPIDLSALMANFTLLINRFRNAISLEQFRTNPCPICIYSYHSNLWETFSRKRRILDASCKYIFDILCVSTQHT